MGASNRARPYKEIIMPLTEKGTKILAAMIKQYGKIRGKSVFYASAKKKVIKGVH